MRILGIAGSLRTDSYNRRLLDQAAAMLPAEAGWQEWDGLAGVPPFNEDDETTSAASVQDLRAVTAAADGLLLATPEYNGSIPGQLKNVVDWMSRPAGRGVLTDLPVTVIGASPSGYGASWAQAELRKVLDRAGARVVDRELPVTRAHEAFTPDGRLTDPALTQQLHQIVRDLAAMSATDGARRPTDALAEAR